MIYNRKKGRIGMKKSEKAKKKPEKKNKKQVAVAKELKTKKNDDGIVVEKEFPEDQKKKKSRKKVPKILIIGVVLLLLTAVAFFVVNFVMPTLRVKGFSEQVEIGFKDEYRDDYGEICYGNIFACDELAVEISGDKVDTEKLGEYQRIYRVKYGDNKEVEYTQKIIVVDRKAPEIEVKDEKIAVCPNGKIPDFEIKVIDNYDGEIKENIEKRFENDEVVISVRDSSGNVSEKNIPGIVEDKMAPEINLNGAEKYEMTLDAIYEIPTPTVLDNCDEVELKTEGGIDTTKVGDYEIIYSAVDNSGNEAKIKRVVSVKPVPENGVIYLTFDDGPGAFTDKLLDVLKKYNVKATFFVTGFGEDRLIKRAFDEGHAIGLHTFTHDYSYVYKNMNNYFDDLNKVQERVKRITGKETFLMRFPGGSSNTVSRNYDGGIHIMSKLVDEVTKRGYKYFDWNVSSGDAGSTTSATGVYNNVIRGLGKGGSYVVLQHDVKGYSVDAVEDIIKYGKSHGYKFSALDASSFTAHHGVNN